jgi:hypothetical protein
MAKRMNVRFGTSTWSVSIPEGWRASHEDGCAQLISDVGALHISCAFKDSDVVDADLREFAAVHLHADAISTPVIAGEFIGFEIAFGVRERFWRHWYLRNGHQAVFITYNCDLDSRGVDDEAIGTALATLTPHGTALPDA